MDIAEFDKLRDAANPVIRESLDFIVKILHAVEHAKPQEEKKSA